MDLKKLTKPLEDTDTAKRFCRRFIEVFAVPAFGAISKAEIDNLVFELLIDAKVIKSTSQVFEIARDLNVTPAKARALLFQWQLRNLGGGSALKSDLIAALNSVRFAKDGAFIVFGVESPLLREELRSRLKRMGVYADASFSTEMVRLSVKHFVEFLDAFLDEGEKRKMHGALIKDGQLKDSSFKAVAFRILKGVAKKAAGEVGGELTDLFEKAVQGILSGDADSVKKAVETIDLDDEILTYA
jgi:hypothetical protein